MLTSIINETEPMITLADVAVCTIASIVLGFILAFVFHILFKDCSRSYIFSLVLIPVIVQIVIMLVNGNLGTAVAVAGAFTLVRFRSMQGTAKEISGIFCTMVIGLATGMGYIGIAILITIIICLLLIIMEKSKFAAAPANQKILKITIPDNLDYTEIFDELFKIYTKSISLDKVKTTNMGAMYELTYSLELKDPKNEKEFIDEIRCRNGNLTVQISRPPMNMDEL